VDLRAAALLGEPARVIDRTRAADVVLQLVAEFGLEMGIFARGGIGLAQLVERVAEGLRDEHAAVGSEVAALVREVIHPHCGPLRRTPASRRREIAASPGARGR